MRRIVVNLAPADLKKAGPAYDLPIALGILMSSEQVFADVSKTLILGELSLDGSLRHTNGVLPMVAIGLEQGYSTVIVPEVDAREATLVKDARIIAVNSLPQLVSCLRGEIEEPVYKREETEEYEIPVSTETDLAYIKGQEHVKRALEVAAAGAHNTVRSWTYYQHTV
jgi:magnesium chelatase family protein